MCLKIASAVPGLLCIVWCYEGGYQCGGYVRY